MRTLGRSLTANFFGPLQTIIPWVSNLYTERLIERTRAAFGDDFWGFWMLGGMSGGGMGFIFAPARRREGQARLQEIMEARQARARGRPALRDGPGGLRLSPSTSRAPWARCSTGADALLPAGFYQQSVPRCLRQEARSLTPRDRGDLQQFTQAARRHPEYGAVLPTLLDRMLPSSAAAQDAGRLGALLDENGFDRVQHEQIRADLRNGRIGLAMNRLPPSTRIDDVPAEALFDRARRPRPCASGARPRCGRARWRW